MARRGSSLNSIDSGLSREINSNFDIVKVVADNISAVATVAGSDLDSLVSALTEATDFTGITVVSGNTSSWDPVSKVLTVETVKGDKGDQGLQGEQGQQGIQGQRGEQGKKGDQGVQGTQGLRGFDGKDGAKGDQGIQGPAGLDLTVEQITYNNDGTFTWQFSDSTNYTTPDLRGPAGTDGAQGVKGDQGVSVHHLKATSTTDLEGDFGTFGEWDTYTFYGDAAETLNLGHFTIRNGLTPEQMVEEGFMLRSTYDLDDSGVVDNSEALGGKPLSQIEEERDIAIANAQLALGTNYTVSDNAERMLLEDLTVSDKVFVVDDGDGKWAHYIVAAVTDGLGSTSTFTVIMDEDTYLNSNTKEGIKSSYESNADTNAFTDEEKSLVGVSTSLDTVSDSLTEAVNELHSEINTISPIVAASEVHRTSDGSDHTFINQDVTDTADVVFNSVQVVTTVNGRDVVADGDKLDTIETGAKDDQVASEVPVTPTGSITSDNVQSALEEVQTDLDTHKSGTGEDHTYIDQDVTSSGTPSFNSVQFNGGTGTQGTVSWNVDEEVLDAVIGSDTVVQIGEEHLVSVVNNTGTTIANGTPVMYIGSVGASGKIAVAPIDGSTPANGELLVGVATSDIPNGGTGKVTKFGKVRGLDTTGALYGETWSAGDILYVDPIVVGGLTNVEPTGASGITPVAAVVNTHHVNGSIIVRAIPVNYNRPSSSLYFEPTGTITATNVQSAIEELQLLVNSNTMVAGTSNNVRFDKILNNLDVIEMVYAGDDLSTVRYNGDNGTTLFYRDVLEYTAGNLTSIKHYYGTSDLSGYSAMTSLSYDGNDNLISTTYTEL